ncbi:hypothetical protein ABE288_07080 [Bacillus salipaludis]
MDAEQCKSPEDYLEYASLAIRQFLERNNSNLENHLNKALIQVN